MKTAILTLFLALSITYANAATITSATTGGNWSSGTTWVGGIVPKSTDEVVINGNVSIDGSVTCAKLTINASKTLSFATGGYTLTLNNNWTSIITNNGTFTAGDGTVKFTGAGIEVSTPITFNNVIVENVSQIKIHGGAIVNGRLKLNGGDFGYDNSNHPVYGPDAVLEINGNYSPSTNPLLWATDNSTKTAPNIVIASGTVTANQGILNLKKTLTVNSGATFNGSTGCINMLSGFQGITNNGTISLGGITVKNGATWNITNNFSLATLKIENGGTVNANSYTLTINNSTINNCGGISGIMQLEAGGTFNPGTSTVVFVPAFNSNVTAEVSGPINFTNMVVSGVSPIVIPVTNTVTISGNITVNTGATVSNPGNIIYDTSATVTNNGSTTGTGFPPTVDATPVTNTFLSGNVVGNKTGAASIKSSTTATLTGNININAGTSKTLTISPGAELNLGTYTVTADTVYIYGKLTVSNSGGLAASFLRSSGSPVLYIGAGSTVIFNSATAQTITARTDYVNLNLTGNGTKTFSTGTYSIGGDFTVLGGNADITTNNPTFNFNGDNAQTIKGLPFKNVSFSGSGNKTLSDSASITGMMTLSGSANLISNGLITLKSTASGTASIGQITGTATITGNINYERYIPAGRLWRFIGWPLNGTTFADSWQNQVYITGAGTGGSLGTTNSNGFDYTATNEPGLYYYNETSTASINAKWTTIPNTNTAISPTRGYRLFIRGDRSQGITLLNGSSYTPLPVTLKGTGTAVTGDVSVSLTCSNGCGSGDGWHLLSNPYPSAIDWNNSSWKAARAAAIGATIYVYNPSLNKYSAWSPTGGTVNGGSSNIASGQSFYIKTNAASTLTFKEAYKVTNGTVGLFGKTSGSLENNLKVQIGDNTKIYDEAVVYMYPNATMGYDQDLDATKPDVGNASISTYTDSVASSLIFNAIPEINNGDSALIYLNIPLVNYTYTYNISFLGMETFGNTSTQFILIDRYTNSSIIISNAAPVYSFNTIANTPASYAANRFQLKLTTASGSLPVKLTSFSGKKSGTKALLYWTTASEINNDRFEIQSSTDGLNYTTIGTVAGSLNSFKPLAYQFTDETPANGINYYRLNQVDRDGASTLSTVISLNFTEQAPKMAISAWPIPATDYITVELNNTEMVMAKLVIRDIVGKTIYEETLFAEEAGYSHPVNIDSFRSGIYFMEVEQNGRNTESIKFIKN